MRYLFSNFALFVVTHFLKVSIIFWVFNYLSPYALENRYFYTTLIYIWSTWNDLYYRWRCMILEEINHCRKYFPSHDISVWMVTFCMSHMLRLCVQQHIHDSQKLSCMVHRTLHVTHDRFVVNNCKVYSSKVFLLWIKKRFKRLWNAVTGLIRKYCSSKNFYCS